MDRLQESSGQANTPVQEPLCAPAKLDSDLHKCHEAINSIDCMSQTQLGQISALCTAMLRAMETPGFWRHPLNVAEMLGLIKYTADDLMNCVNCVAENVGCNFVDDINRAAEGRVLDAFRQVMREEGEHVQAQ